MASFSHVVTFLPVPGHDLDRHGVPLETGNHDNCVNRLMLDGNRLP